MMNLIADNALLPAIAASLLALGLIGILHRRDRRFTPASSARLFLCARITLLGLILLLILDPVFTREQPDPESFHVAVLADTSGSMLTRDTAAGGPSRLEAMNELLLDAAEGAPGLLHRLGERFRIRTYSFSDTLRPNPMRETLAFQPGGTALGTALREVLDSSSREDPPGAVVLISDGISNRGADPVGVAMEFGRRGLPIHVVGVGQGSRTGDLVLRVPENTVRAERDGILSFATSVENTGDQPAEVTLSASTPEREVFARTVSVAPGTRASIQVEAPAPAQRQSTLQISIASSAADTNTANNLGFVTVELSDPERIRVLLLAGSPGWEGRFLARLARDNPQLQLDRVMRLAEGRFLRTRSTEDAPEDTVLDSFPSDPEWFFGYEVILLTGDCATMLAPEAIAALKDFAGNRGGGVIFLGDPRPWIDTQLSPLLPVTSYGEIVAAAEPLPLRFQTLPVFTDQAGGPLFGNPSPVLPAGQPAPAEVQIKRAVRTVAEIAGSSEPVLSVQAYGAGRTALWSAPATWSWRLSGPVGADQFKDFWTALLTWSALGGKPRLDPMVDGAVVDAGGKVDLGLVVLGRDFLPRSDAMVRVDLLREGDAGEPRKLRASPELETPGRYRLALSDLEPGNYRARYTVDLPDGERLENEAVFAVVPDASEQGDTLFRESVLRDIARLSGGSYRGFRDSMVPDDLALSPTIPVREERIHWARHPLVLLLAGALALGEWYYRRRGGLN